MNRKERRIAASLQKPESAGDTNQQKQNVHRLLAEAISLHQQQQLKEAEVLYKQILELQPDHKDAKHLLAVVAYRHGRVDQGIALMKEVLAKEPRFAEGYSNLGNMHMAKGQLDLAVAAFAQCIELKPSYADAHNNLGNALKLQGKLQAAANSYNKAIELAPDAADAYCNLGVICQEQSRLREAEDLLLKALERNPHFAEAHNNLGITYQQLHKYKEARAAYDQAIALKPDYAEAYSNLGNFLKEHRSFDEAVTALKKSIELKPFFPDAYANLALVYKDMGKIDEARASYRKALAISYKPAIALREVMLIASVVTSEEDITRFREGVETKLDMLKLKSGVIDDPLRDVGGTNFFMAYHGLNDRAVQVKTAEFYLKNIPGLDWASPQAKRWEMVAPLPRIRVCIASAFLYSHTIGKLVAGIIEHLPRDQFEVVILRLSSLQDEFAKRLDASVERVVYLPRQLLDARDIIAQEEPDVLIYPDIGMDPMSYFLAFARLAPIQCAMWGHPVTTGVPNVDYFLSSTLIEPEGAQQHYTETLVQMKNLPCYAYRAPGTVTPKHTKEAFKLPSEGHIYLCPQSLFKMHPKFDATLGALLKKDPNGTLVFIDGFYPSWTETLQARFERAFPEESDRVVFIPRVSDADFPALLSFADVVLDPPGFGGGQTSYEALGAGMPIVTLPGEFMRGRVTYGCYQAMGVTDLIAKDEHDYVEIATRLAHDTAWRERMQEHIRERSAVLFENTAVIDELSRFLTEAVTAARKREKVSGW